MATPRLFRLAIPVDDIEAAVAFYGAAFGEPGERVWRNRHYFHCGEVVLAVVEPAEKDFRPPSEPRILYFAVDDLPAAHSRVRAAGPGRIDEEITEQPWGERSFYVEDPFGTRLCFVDATSTYTGT
ncbi:VOC family protein [Amycolatopsis acidicola]|uniref:VOC family protein n=1 Tax=Amycolatopsis acidicola TaxID=2596893 RepID=A0A5N0UM81_9PSEU|nr:VOC family protein [Amycolatopsis acidicola]KAA9151199.1 VOC family protein [Amycolatopsis acidicola]